MSKFRKKIIVSIISFLLILIIIISSFFIIKYFINKKRILNVYKVYSEENMQNKLDEKKHSKLDDFMLKFDNETVIGVIQINKINFEGLVYNGISMHTLNKGVGHFENTPYLNGNVCLAAHNYKKYWGKLHTLDTGDTITYTSFLGTKEYSVTSINIIEEDDFTLLKDTADNRLTLITCVLNNPSKRLCVQAIEQK